MFKLNYTETWKLDNKQFLLFQWSLSSEEKNFKKLMLAGCTELRDWDTQKIDVSTKHVPHTQSSAQCANINFFVCGIYYLNCMTELGEQEGLLIV